MTISDLQARAEAIHERKEHLLTYPELMQIPVSKQIVKGLIGENEVGVFFGSSTAGKSFLCLDMLWHIANGCDWFDYRIKSPRPVVYFALEGRGGISRRMQAIEIRKGIQTLGNMNFMIQTLDLTDDDEIDVWAEVINERGLKSSVVAVDTLAQAAIGIDENSSEGMGRVIAGAQKLSKKISGTVILVHHAGKDTTRGARGWSGLKGAMDFQIEVNEDDKGRHWKVEKVKDSDSGKIHPFALEVLTIKVDEDGDEVTTCVISRPVVDFKDPTDQQIEDQVWRFIGSKVDERQYPSARSMRGEMSRLGVSRQSLEDAIARLKSKLRLEDRAVPRKPGTKGGAQKYLYPIGRESVFDRDDIDVP
jgi:RecA-family ATPase